MLASAGAALLSPVAAASAFDLPPLEGGGLTAAMIPYTVEDSEACRQFAAKPNPPESKQLASAHLY